MITTLARRISPPAWRCLLLLLGGTWLPLHAADLPDLFAERVRSCVTVEFLVENELDRQPGR